MIDFILEAFKKGGWVLLPIFVASVWAWFMVVLSWFRLNHYALSKSHQRKLLKDPSLLNQYLTRKGGRRFKKTLAGELLAALSELTEPTRDIFESKVDEILKWRSMVLERNISLIGVIASMAPLLGLLGTVTGMITTFRVIGAFGTSNPALMADSISESLMTTQDGLIVAFPLMIIHMFLQNKCQAIGEDAEELAVQYMNYKLHEQKRLP